MRSDNTHFQVLVKLWHLIGIPFEVIDEPEAGAAAPPRPPQARRTFVVYTPDTVAKQLMAAASRLIELDKAKRWARSSRANA